MDRSSVEIFEQQLIDKHLDLVGRILAIRNMTQELHWLLQNKTLEPKRLENTLNAILEFCGDPK